MEGRVIDGYHEAILARLDHFCGIYGASPVASLTSVVSMSNTVYLLTKAHACFESRSQSIIN